MKKYKRGPQTEEHRKKISQALKGIKRTFTVEHRKKLSDIKKKALVNPKNHPHYKGKKAGYRAIHVFIVRKLGRAIKCSRCLKESGRIHWSNIDHKYSRDLKDWVQLCSTCHGENDKKLRLIIKIKK